MLHCRRMGHRPSRVPDHPWDLDTCGAVPQGSTKPPLALTCKRSPIALRSNPWLVEVILVANDGGCGLAAGQPLAGWGLFSRDTRLGGAHPAMPEPCQTAQRGEECAVTAAVALAPVRPFVLTDNQYIERGLRALQDGAGVRGKHAHLWTVLRRGSRKVAAMTWVKAHLTEAEAAARGTPHSYWALNEEGDAPTSMGLRSHVEDLGVRALWASWGPFFMERQAPPVCKIV